MALEHSFVTLLQYASLRGAHALLSSSLPPLSCTMRRHLCQGSHRQCFDKSGATRELFRACCSMPERDPLGSRGQLFQGGQLETAKELIRDSRRKTPPSAPLDLSRNEE
jgi:hypothetical protein